MLDRMNIPRRLGFAFVSLNVVAAAVMIACGVSLAMISSVTARNTEPMARKASWGSCRKNSTAHIGLKIERISGRAAMCWISAGMMACRACLT